MKIAEFNINQALGLTLYNSINLGKKTILKGSVLNELDILELKYAGVSIVFGGFMGDYDVTSQVALGILAAKICSDNIAYRMDEGLCQIISLVDGAILSSEERVAKFNRLSPNIILNVVEPYSVVKENEIIASIEITTPIVSQENIDEIIFALSGNDEILKVKEDLGLKVGLIYSHTLDDTIEAKHFTNIVKKLVKNFSNVNLDFVHEYHTKHTVNDIANTIEISLKADNDIVFILPAQQQTCSEDVVYTAMLSIVDEVVNSKISQIGANDLLIAEKRNKKIISLPYSYDYTDTKVINKYIRQAMFSGKLRRYEFEHYIPIAMKSGLTLLDDNGLIRASNSSKDLNNANIAIIILAAGIGSRSGRNKLMVEDAMSQPIFMRSIKAALGSKASPVFVVTGYHDAEMETYLDKIDVNILYNPAFRSGIKTSLSLGLRSIPGFMEGVVILPADMPNITSSDIDVLIDAFEKGRDKQVVMFENSEMKSNPILWSKSLYDKADIVPEGSNLRPIFMEHADYTKYIKVGDASKLLDVNYPSDFENIIGMNKL